MTSRELIGMLPEYRDEWVEITPRQTIRSIIREVVNAHQEFSPHYDMIAGCFDSGSVKDICGGLYNFCKENINYKEESDEDQTTAIPAGILSRGYGDCKHYAGFCGGILDGINRATGKNIKWKYRFASYRFLDSSPHHVFIVVDGQDGEIWIDPTPGVEGRSPVWYEDHKVKTMALRRNIAGIGDVAEGVPSLASITDADFENALADVDTSSDVSDEDYKTISTLLNFGVIDEMGNVSVERMNELEGELSRDDYDVVAGAYNTYLASAAQVGGFFDGLWRTVKTVGMAVPRNAYLGLVALNVFGMASKGEKILAYEDTKNELLDKWYSLGGNKSALEDTIRSGAKKNAILGSVSIGAAPAAAAPAWLAVAAPILAILVPLMTSLLKKKNAYEDFAYLDGQLPAQYGGTGNSLTDILKNPVVLIGGAALLAYLLIPSEK